MCVSVYVGLRACVCAYISRKHIYIHAHLHTHLFMSAFRRVGVCVGVGVCV